jgi:cytochrome b561
MAIMILIEVPLGYVMAGTYGPALKLKELKPLHDVLAQLHHTNGFMILGLAILRLGWAVGHPGPALPGDIPAYQQSLARLTQGLLYAVLIALPLSGWAALTVLADSEAFGKTAIWFFGTDSFPRMPFIEPKPFNDPNGYRVFGSMHVILIYIGAGLLALHILGAFWHHLVRRDGVLWAMWPRPDQPARRIP